MWECRVDSTALGLTNRKITDCAIPSLQQLYIRHNVVHLAKSITWDLPGLMDAIRLLRPGYDVPLLPSELPPVVLPASCGS